MTNEIANVSTDTRHIALHDVLRDFG